MVFNALMKRFLLLLTGLAVGALALLTTGAFAEKPRTRAASVTEVGRAPDNAAPMCPGNPCNVVTRTTGYGRTANGVAQPNLVARDGRLVSLTLRLGKPTAKQITFFNKNYGGASQVVLTVLRGSRRPKLTFTVVAQSAITRPQRYFGQTAQFPLHNSLDVRKGDVVAITVPTWAPILASGLSRSNSWRASRGSGRMGCNDTATFATQTAQTSLGARTQYLCAYVGARLTYSATLISTP